ncbi:MAG TPA: hypothetical protein VMA30_16350 [Xanthobacteraceae bacterium]|nr:hypothetical protein [Xanthobacteraceae bacterium]
MIYIAEIKDADFGQRLSRALCPDFRCLRTNLSPHAALTSAEAAGDENMFGGRFILVLAILLSATTISFAQSQRNYGPNGPATGDSFGEPYSGSAAARRGDWLPYSARYHHHWRRHWYR